MPDPTSSTATSRPEGLDVPALVQAIRLCAGSAGTDEPEETATAGWDRITKAAGSALLLPALWPAARRVEHLGSRRRLLLEAAFVLNWERNERILAQTEEIALAMNRAGITPVALKGLAHLASGLWPHAGARVLGDIDLLVHPDEAAQALAALGSGLVRTDAAGHLPERWEMHQHLPAVHKPGWKASLELHTAVMGRRFGNLLPTEELIRRSVPARLGKAEVRLPCMEHRAMHAIAHAFISDRLYFAPALAGRDMVDLMRLDEMHGSAIDWDHVQHRFALQGWASLPAIVNRIFETLLEREAPFGPARWHRRIDARRWTAMLHARPMRRLGLLHAGLRDYSWMASLGGETRRHVISRVASRGFFSSWLRYALLGARRGTHGVGLADSPPAGRTPSA